MAATIIPAFPQYLDNDGEPLAGGKLYSYEAGLSSPQAVYTDSDLTIPFSNPIILDASGRPSGPIFLLTAPAYKFILTDANDVSVGPTYDHVIANAAAS